MADWISRLAYTCSLHIWYDYSADTYTGTLGEDTFIFIQFHLYTKHGNAETSSAIE